MIEPIAITAGLLINSLNYDEEIWEKKEPTKGDHIRVSRGVYTHHGIYVSDIEVIHFTGEDGDSVFDVENNAVVATDINRFLKDGLLEVKVYNEIEIDDLYPVEGIVSYARACIGDKGYDLIFNNCEHFANICTLGRFRSRQVEKVLGGKGMAWWNPFSWFKSSSGSSRSTSSTTYEPDKVKVAEIEREIKLRLVDKENERIELMKNAKLDILEYQTRAKLAEEEAKLQGFQRAAEAVVKLQEQLNEVMNKRLIIIESGAMSLVKDMEAFYSQVNKDLDKENQIYSEEKLPKLLEQLKKYQEGTPEHTLYQKQIDYDIERQKNFVIAQYNQIIVRQNTVLDSMMRGKERLLNNAEGITEGMLTVVQKQIGESNNKMQQLTGIDNNKQNSGLINNEEAKMLE